MMTKRWRYRVRQFVRTLRARPDPAGLEFARQTLTPAQLALFRQMQACEQAHALHVLRRVIARSQAQGLQPPVELLVAALLHDVGKTRYPLRWWERVLIVLGNALLPGQARRWGNCSPRGWARPFVVAARHPVWGAELAAERDTAPRAVALIRRHQEPPGRRPGEEERWLSILQAADDES